MQRERIVGKQPARAVADQQQEALPRRLLQDLQYRVGGIAVHLLRTIEDYDAPALLGRGQAKKGGDLARVVGDDFAAQPPPARIPGALDGQEVGVPARGDATEDGALGRVARPSAPAGPRSFGARR